MFRAIVKATNAVLGTVASAADGLEQEVTSTVEYRKTMRPMENKMAATERLFEMQQELARLKEQDPVGYDSAKRIAEELFNK